MFKGCSAVITGNATKSLVRFSVYNWATKFMADNSGEASAPQIVVAGMFTGLCESMMVVPFENIKTTMIERSSLTVAGAAINPPVFPPPHTQLTSHTHTIHHGSHPKKKTVRPPAPKPNPAYALYEVTPGVEGLLGNVRNMYQIRGLRAFVQGFSPTIVRQVTNSMVRFTTYNFLKQLVHPNDSSEPMSGVLAFTLGALAGAVEVLATQPIDVVKSRMQTVNGIKLYGSSMLCSYRIFVEEGPTRLWAGLLPRFVKVTFSGGIVFGVYETANKLVLRAMNENPFSWK
jgi:solute carrier family 25 citrate transporter 1